MIAGYAVADGKLRPLSDLAAERDAQLAIERAEDARLARPEAAE